jgi:hypothetical protein
VDLRSQMTVFVTTVGKPVFDQCMAALSRQDCEFTGPVVIRNVAPMDAAFQRMLDLCRTPYYCQVDEDMVLRPYAVRVLHDDIAHAGPNEVIAVRPLWDTHLQRDILGCKAYRHEIVRRYPYLASVSCEMDQAQRFERDGYAMRITWPIRNGAQVFDLRDAHVAEIVGDHVVDGWEVVYERYYNLYSKYARFPWLAWLGSEAPKILNRAGIDSESPDLWYLLGMVAGLVCPQAGEKDYRRNRSVPGLRELRPIVLGGPEELGVFFGSIYSQRDPAVADLIRLFDRFPRSIRRARVFGARDRDPLGHAQLLPLLEFLVARLPVRLETAALAGLGQHLPELFRFGDRLGLTLLVDLPVEQDVPGLVAAVFLAAGSGMFVRPVIRIGIDRYTVGQLAELLRRVTDWGAGVEVRQRLSPVVGETHDAFWRRAITRACTEEIAHLDALRELFPAVDFCDPLPEAWDAQSGCCDSPFRGIVLGGDGGIGGCLAGSIHPGLQFANVAWPAQSIWYENHLFQLRGSLTGRLPALEACQRCPLWQGGV